jgi:DHA1 family bicyclomycin/chloramphenicol resistance-like MFS transporter
MRNVLPNFRVGPAQLLLQRRSSPPNISGMFCSLAQGLSMPYAQAGAMAVDTELAGSAAGVVVFSQLFWSAALQQLTALLANGSWVPMATVHLAAMIAALFAGWIAVRAER